MQHHRRPPLLPALQLARVTADAEASAQADELCRADVAAANADLLTKVKARWAAVDILRWVQMGKEACGPGRVGEGGGAGKGRLGRQGEY